ncbi:hypothetical protein DL766_001968 [Monosporascus sp. MC13-8B]|uniref:Uncharacterized protein n=1 Tax=Monosporascus cannonballus TaxID=155416 RepID=A0ABY0H6V8_9PEZI|nr:hypothetical protein DL762_004869 [Monosporascus cannonballus]RYP36466.1 hypothetical protein DL766_001968 [Monosporascus sp. MC13-8B]
MSSFKLRCLPEVKFPKPDLSTLWTRLSVDVAIRWGGFFRLARFAGSVRDDLDDGDDFIVRDRDFLGREAETVSAVSYGFIALLRCGSKIVRQAADFYIDLYVGDVGSYPDNQARKNVGDF